MSYVTNPLEPRFEKTEEKPSSRVDKTPRRLPSGKPRVQKPQPARQPSRAIPPIRLPTFRLPSLANLSRPEIDRLGLRRAYWDVIATMSLILNAVLIVVLLVVSRWSMHTLDTLNRRVLFDGLYQNFGKMDAAHIRATIPVSETIHISLPIRQTTVVTLTESTLIRGARVSILNTPADITLPAGTRLPIALDMTVEADVPISLTVPVDIPLAQTELHEPFSNLQETFKPAIALLHSYSNWSQLGLCRFWKGLCNWWFEP